MANHISSFSMAALFFISFILPALVIIQGVAASRSIPIAMPYDSNTFSSEPESNLQNFASSERRMKRRDLKREMIGSVAPTCTYNECKGCKYKCRAEQVPVEGNDPMNSPYHYKCVCRR